MMADEPGGQDMLEQAKAMWAKLKSGLSAMWKELLTTTDGKESGKVVEEGVAKDGSAIYTIELMSGKKFKMKLTKTGDTDAVNPDDPDNPGTEAKYTVAFLLENGMQFTRRDIAQSKVREEIRKFIRDKFKDDEEDGESFESVTDESGNDVTLERSQEHVANQQTNSAKKLNITVKRIVGCKEDTISLTGIMCSNITAEEALSIVNNVMDDQGFTDALPAGESAFRIIDEGNTVDVQPTDEPIDIRGSFIDVMKESMRLQNDLSFVYWNLQDPVLERLRNMIDDKNWNIRYQISTLAELCYEHTGSVLHPFVLIRDAGEPDVPVDGPIDKDVAKDIVTSSVRRMLDTLECYYCNFPHDVQPVIDGWIREWKDFVDNRLKRYTEANTAPGVTVAKTVSGM